MTAPDYRGMLSAEAVARLVADARAEAWDACVEESHDMGWLDWPGRRSVLARNPYRAPDATERPVSASDGSGGVEGPAAAARPADRRTGLGPGSVAHGMLQRAIESAEERRTGIELQGLDGPECGEPGGTMRCQLRRGHDGPHEDWRGVAPERRAR